MGCASGHGGSSGASALAEAAATDGALDLCLATIDAHISEKHLTGSVQRADQMASKADWRRLAVLHDRQGDDARAETEYLLAVDVKPRDAERLNALGYFHYSRGRYAEAEKWLRQATAVNPGYQKAWVNLGLTLAQQGHLAEGLAILTNALGPAQAYAKLGMILAERGESGAARDALAKALRLNPEMKEARLALAHLPNPSPARPDANRIATATPLPAAGDDDALVLELPVPVARASRAER
jgi:Tfp pilus assembly protein PilF